ncbi:hypothetical protein EHQ58_08240 [Leptospira ognonensis]|uniref:Phage holin family protein n=1 Tax=Leptospira ognonensis TaxID=2484945 RepID=A0A4R9K4A9_9LEPT|nr:phage holin family protein [Leptospira ognonensis]TGL59724.1 hypothetical protein EHQ58_08240 [Leptospira ognonensis]
MIHFIVSILLQAIVVLFVFPWIHSDFRVKGDATNAIWIVIGFIVLNWIVRWLFVISTLGLGWLLYYLSLGLLGLLANAIVLILLSRMFPNLLGVPSFSAAFWGGLCLSLASLLMRR